ncbi:thioredoxin-like fold domain-containing protein MRL7 homolog, chloroplastic [Magnolia sinica]|uniref:thioredoxin-like fold domain-containing protein MRL7 homolog, chloroplastic n=1 Tax=Magnolia sinica TaxID=86752 RepID=UPI002658A6E3|nr:thioredoxin-like fold domain-containing protein MRL7 homolog, chloroplastic [Magnolia sinica]
MSLFLTLSNPKPIFGLFLPTNPNPCFQPKPLILSFSISASSAQNPNPNPRRKRRTPKPETPPDSGNPDEIFPAAIPRKPRRGRRSEAVAVEDFVRDSLERTFASIREQNSSVLNDKEEVLKKRIKQEADCDGEYGDGGGRREEVVEEDDPDWPVDAEIGWGIRASEYFEKHPIRNVVEDGMEIDWEGEMDDSWVKEINCLEWESFAFHPSPLIVLVFERYNRAADNWKLLKELEKAIKVYWGAKDRLPPRTVKIDINIERDLAYALKVRECPQLLFLRGNKILYREKVVRTADELVQMIAHFYYNAKKPLWVDDTAMASPY